MASWASVIMRYGKNVWFVNHCKDIFCGRHPSRRASENYTELVDFEIHLPEWRVLSEFSFQHCMVWALYTSFLVLIFV